MGSSGLVDVDDVDGTSCNTTTATDGPFQVVIKYKLSQITDGLTKTVGYSERHRPAKA